MGIKPHFSERSRKKRDGTGQGVKGGFSSLQSKILRVSDKKTPGSGRMFISWERFPLEGEKDREG